MKFKTYISLFIEAVLAVALVVLCTSFLFGQDKSEHKAKHKEFCSGNNYPNGDKVSFRDMREMALPATGNLAVDGGKNGGVRVIGENRSDVLVRACIQTWGSSDEAAKALANSIRIATSPAVKAEGADENGWSVSYEVRVPQSTNLKLNAHNGGISISTVDGMLEFETTNGGVNLHNVSGDVKGRTTNGGVNVSLSGTSWKGSGLDVQTSNGGVNLTIPENYAANIETGTVNGGFKSDIPSLSITTEDIKGETPRRRGSRITTTLNGGGAPIRVVTTNGGIKINSTEKSVNY
jgi:hypothetical protein